MIIVDGYNVIYKWKCLKKFKNNLELARSKLVNILANYQGYTGEELVVVFDSSIRADAHFSEDAPQNIKVIYAPSSKGADIYIEQLVKAETNPNNVTVITKDTLERTAVTGIGAHVLSPEKFETEVIKIVAHYKQCS